MLNKKALAATAAAAEPVYVEDVFSTYLYAGTSANQTITNGVDLSGEGGLVWIKARNLAVSNVVFDSARGEGPSGNYAQLFTDSTTSQTADPNNGISSFNADGFSLTNNETTTNRTGYNYVSWTFRKAEKFFDVVTYTGNGSNRTISHNLGSVPGCIIVKRTDTTAAWAVYHRSLANTEYLVLNTTAVKATGATYWNSTTPTSTVFSLGTSTDVNANNGTYVAYLFAHDAGGFGEAGDQNVISCGSYTGTGGTTTPNQINLGYEAQWVLVKPSSGVGNWAIADMMRGSWIASDGSANFNELLPNTSGAENANNYGPAPTATGFAVSGVGFPNASGVTYIYIAIRRGPMKTPEAGTEVLVPYAYDGSGAGTYTTGINQDLFFAKSRNSGSYVWNWYDRLRGANQRLQSNATNAEASVSGVTDFNNTSMIFAASDGFSSASPFGGPYIGYAFRRAPGFFDVVCYTGTGSARTVSHNLGVAPELMIVKKRSSSTLSNWVVYASPLSNASTSYLFVNTTDAVVGSNTVLWNSTDPTSTVFSVGTASNTNASGETYVAYLFASCPGVSKIGTVTVASSAINVDCGFTSSARFVLLKRTSDASGWIVFDSARGIVAGDDPYLYLNSSAAENSDGASDIIDTYSSGFTLPAGGLSGITGEGTYLYLAIA